MVPEGFVGLTLSSDSSFIRKVVLQSPALVLTEVQSSHLNQQNLRWSCLHIQCQNHKCEYISDEANTSGEQSTSQYDLERWSRRI